VIIVIGRGRSGTRLASRLLYENGVATGKLSLNFGYDMIPPPYRAADLYSRRVVYKGDYVWDFTEANQSDTPEEFITCVNSYLSQIKDLPEPKFFKLPETTLCYPWVKAIFPDAAYVYWVRDPRGAERHNSDRLDLWNHWGIDRVALDDVLGEVGLENASRSAPRSVVQAMSWKYQYDIVKSVPEPERFITVRYEDFCIDHEREVARLAEFLGIELEPLSDISLDGFTSGRARIDTGTMSSWSRRSESSATTSFRQRSHSLPRAQRAPSS
jgi:hypothetical protein